MNHYQRRAVQAKRSAVLGQPENFGHGGTLDVSRETTLAALITVWLRGLSYEVYSTQAGGNRPTRQARGLPDLFVAHPAWRIFAWVEVKTPEAFRKRDHGRSADQLAFHEAVQAAGCPVLTVCSVTDAQNQLDALRGRQMPFGG